MEMLGAMHAVTMSTISPIKATLPAYGSNCAAPVDGRSALVAISAVLKQRYDSCRRSEYLHEGRSSD